MTATSAADRFHHQRASADWPETALEYENTKSRKDVSTKTEESQKRQGHVTLLNVRCSYLKIVKPEAVHSERGNPDARKRYDMVVLVPKENDVAYKAVKGEVDRIVKEKKTVKFKKANLLIKDGDDDEAPEEYRGYWYFTASRSESQGAPPVYGRRKAEGEIKPGHKDFPYSGANIHVKVGIYHTDKGGDKICSSIELVKFAGDNTPFGEGSKASADDLPDDEEEADALDDDDDDVG